MKALIQRVKQCSVSVEGEVISKIGHGLLIFLGIAHDDNRDDAVYLVRKIPELRIFEDHNNKMNLSLIDINAEIMVVSQFTLLGDCRNGRRPSFINAARPDKAKDLYDFFIYLLKENNIKTQSGKFQAMMDVLLINDGPVTIIIDSPSKLSIIGE